MKKSDPKHCVLTPHGFTWGLATATRIASLPGGDLVIGLETPRAAMDVYISPTGLIRIFDKKKKGELE
jgi:hypothetical protein